MKKKMLLGKVRTKKLRKIKVIKNVNSFLYLYVSYEAVSQGVSSMQNKKSKVALQVNDLAYESLTTIQAERYDQPTVVIM